MKRSLIDCEKASNKRVKVRSDKKYTFGHLEQLLQRFPDLECLNITGCCLKDIHFTLICQHMPKLKALKVLNGSSRNEIPVKTILDSLKDLPYLEKLEIESSSELCFSDEYQWPQLPELTDLHLIGDCFQAFDQRLFSEITHRSPKISKFELKRQFHTPYYISYVDSRLFIRKLGNGLTHLSLPCERNNELVSDIIEYCPNLQEISIQGPTDFTFTQKMALFREHPTMNSITSEIVSREGDNMNVIRNRQNMTRNYFTEIKRKFFRENNGKNE